MKKIIGIVLLLAIILSVLFLPIFPVGVEKLPVETLLQFHRVGGVAGFMDDLNIDKPGHVYKWGKDIGSIQNSELAVLEDYISNHKFSAVYTRTSLINIFFKKVNDSLADYPDAMYSSLKVSDGNKTYEVQMDSYFQNVLDPWLKISTTVMNPSKKTNLLSTKSYSNTKFGVTMYPPDGWYAKQDEYFNALIMFLDRPQSTISDFEGPNVIITLTAYPNSNHSFTSEKFINRTKEEMERSIELGKEAGWTETANLEFKEINRKYSLFKAALLKKENVVIDGKSGIAYDFGVYFGGSGYGRTIVFENDEKLFVIIAEVKNENTWIKNKDKILQSMVSIKFTK